MIKEPKKNTTKALQYIALREQGYTYKAIATSCGEVSADAVRNIIRRYNKKQWGSYKGHPRQAEAKRIKDVPLPHEYDVDTNDPILEEVSEPLEIWNVDIERFPRIEYAWGAKKYNKFTPEMFLVEEGRMVSFAAKKLGGPVLFSSEYHHGRQQMLETLWHVFNRAHIVVGWNSKRFDVPHTDGELRDAGFPTYRPFKQIDLMTAVRQRFNYEYNTMSSVAHRWGLEEQKMDNEGFNLWKKCMAWDPDAWDTMRKYNMQDVRTCEAAYLDNRAWLTGSIPNLGLWTSEAGAWVCPACASDNIVEDGTAATPSTLYKAYQCQECGYRARSNERVNTTKLRSITR